MSYTHYFSVAFSVSGSKYSTPHAALRQEREMIETQIKHRVQSIVTDADWARALEAWPPPTTPFPIVINLEV